MRTPKQIANLRPAKKGEVRNPLGAGSHNKEIKAIKALTQKEIADVGTLLLGGNESTLNEARMNPDSSVLKVWICSIAENAIKKGDATAFNALLDRIVGKVKEDNRLTVIAEQGVPHMTEEEAAKLIQDANAKVST